MVSFVLGLERTALSLKTKAEVGRKHLSTYGRTVLVGRKTVGKNKCKV